MSTERRAPMERIEELAKENLDSPDKVNQFFDIWVQASKNNDEAALNCIIADEYTFVDPEGRPWNKKQMFGSVIGGNPSFNSFQHKEFTVRSYGKDVALKRAIIDVKGSLKGQTLDGQYRLANLFRRDETGWKLSYCQLTKIQDGEELSQVKDDLEL
jgi:ketosteroid isomerase-like protein